MITKKRAKKRMTPAEQSGRFIEAAKKAEADESGADFERAINKIVPPKKAPQRKQP